MIVVLIPVLNRPHRVAPLVENLATFSTTIHVRPLFLCSPNDDEELAAIKAVGADKMIMPWVNGPGDYAKKMNYGFRVTGEPFVFLGADDLVFHAAWPERALAAHAESGKLVIGTNDLGNQRVMDGKASTHTLVAREYLERGTIDDPTKLLHEGYVHNWVDDEFIQTAMHRDEFVHAGDARVEHLHPSWAKAEMDSTYEQGLVSFDIDRELYESRCHFWGRRPGFFHE